LPFCHRTFTVPLPKPGYPKQLKHLGDHLRARRIDLGLLQRDAAAEIGVDTATVTNWELGNTEPEVRFLPALITFLGHNPLPGPETCGQAVKRERLSLGLSKERLADLAGIDEATVRRLEADTKGMAHRVRQAVRTVLGLDPTSSGT